MKNEGAHAIIEAVVLVDPESGIIWLKDKNDTHIKRVASPEEQLKGLEVDDRVEVRLEEQSSAGFPESLPERNLQPNALEVNILVSELRQQQFVQGG